MKKYIKLLMESLFDSDNFDFNSNNEITDIVNDNIKANNFKECNDVDDINYHILDKFNIYSKLVNTINYAVSNYNTDKFNITIENDNILFLDENNIELRISLLNLYFHIKIIKEVTEYNKNIIVNKFIITNNKNQINVTWCIKPDKSNSEQNKDIQLPQYIYKTNNKYNLSKNKELYNLVLSTILDNLYTQYIYDEIKRDGEVYPVKFTDLDKCQNLFHSNNFIRFDKINNKKQLIPILAGTLLLFNYKIINNGIVMKYIEQILNFDYTAILEIICGYPINNRNNQELTILIRMLHKLVMVNDAHIKDVFATYNAEKL